MYCNKPFYVILWKILKVSFLFLYGKKISDEDMTVLADVHISWSLSWISNWNYRFTFAFLRKISQKYWYTWQSTYCIYERSNRIDLSNTRKKLILWILLILLSFITNTKNTVHTKLNTFKYCFLQTMTQFLNFRDMDKFNNE